MSWLLPDESDPPQAGINPQSNAINAIGLSNSFICFVFQGGSVDKADLLFVRVGKKVVKENINRFCCGIEDRQGVKLKGEAVCS